MKNFAKIAIFILISTITFSCYKPLEFSNFESANMDFNNSHGQIILKVKVKNPNFYKIKIIKTNLEVFINDDSLGEINDDLNVSIAANSSASIEIPMNINLTDIISNTGNFLTFFSKSYSTKIKVEGTVIGKTFFGKKKIKINQQKTISK